MKLQAWFTNYSHHRDLTWGKKERRRASHCPSCSLPASSLARSLLRSLACLLPPSLFLPFFFPTISCPDSSPRRHCSQGGRRRRATDPSAEKSYFSRRRLFCSCVCLLKRLIRSVAVFLVKVMEELSQLGVNTHRASSSSSSPAAAAAASSTAAVAAAVAPPPPSPSSSSLLGKRLLGWPPINPLHNHPFPFHLDPASSHTRSAAATSSTDADHIKAKIVAHPRYSALLSAYINCRKVGAPPGVRERLLAAAPEHAARQRAALGCGDLPTSSHDPDLDRFMEAYCQMLAKHEEDLSRPLREANEFLRNAEAELNSITHGGSFRVLYSDENYGSGACSSEEEQELEEDGIREASDELLPSAAAAETNEPDVELKKYLLRRYSGHLAGLRQELCKKKKKKGKLPKEAIQKLLHWWEMHYKWPYPSEAEKVALAESTGLDQKQINNWFINQRKRHWKPTDQDNKNGFVFMDAAGEFSVAPPSTHHAAALYMASDGLYHLNAP